MQVYKCASSATCVTWTLWNQTKLPCLKHSLGPKASVCIMQVSISSDVLINRIYCIHTIIKFIAGQVCTSTQNTLTSADCSNIMSHLWAHSLLRVITSFCKPLTLMVLLLLALMMFWVSGTNMYCMVYKWAVPSKLLQSFTGLQLMNSTNKLSYGAVVMEYIPDGSIIWGT